MPNSTLTRRDLLTLPGALAFAATAEASPPTHGHLKVLILGAHPDDPETGAGGTAAALAERGHDVVLAYLTRGEAGIEGASHAQAARIRSSEALAACSILGTRPLFLGQIDGATEVTAARYDEVRATLDKERPDIVLAHWPVDTHRDHRVASLLAYDSWLTMGRSFALYYFEVMTGTQTQTFQPTDFVDISAVVTKKHAACFAHRSQGIEAEYPHSHGPMEIFRGMEMGCACAEAFVRHSRSRIAPLAPAAR
jgi:LmbE family N-acetylglucosaminyl deacetylase